MLRDQCDSSDLAGPALKTPSIVINALAAAGVVALSGNAGATTFDVMSAGRCGEACAADIAGNADLSTITSSTRGLRADSGIEPSGSVARPGLSLSGGHFSPFVGGFPTFVASDFAITDRSEIASIIFDFGLGPDAFLPGAPSLAPEPTSLLLLGSGLLGLCLITLERRARR